MQIEEEIVILLNWENIPDKIKNDCVRNYYNILAKKRKQLIIKRIFDLSFSLILCIIAAPIILLIAILIKCTSKGSVFFKQNRVTQYGEVFRIFKFRTMHQKTETSSVHITAENDSRITKLGQVLRKFRLDEIPQLFNIVAGQMSFVGTRPEVLKYVDHYTDEMKASLLMPAGLTSLASIKFKDESKLLSGHNIEQTYFQKILPEKMKYNLLYIEQFNLLYDIKLMLKTVFSVIKIN